MLDICIHHIPFLGLHSTLKILTTDVYTHPREHVTHILGHERMINFSRTSTHDACAYMGAASAHRLLLLPRRAGVVKWLAGCYLGAQEERRPGMVLPLLRGV
jgi:hypothetical protein